MRHLILISTALFWGAALTLAVAAVATSPGEMTGSAASPPAGATRPAASPTPTPRRVSLATLQRHASAGDCWLAIRGRIYDVSRYVDRHPAPPRAILDWCGKDATRAFATKGTAGRPHSAQAWAQLASLQVGELGGR
jgi:hypothetical protein